MADSRPRNADGEADDEPSVAVSACETSPGRVVFTEEGNTDAWIATDLTVEVER